MANLVITKQSIGEFSFVLDGDPANEVRNLRNDLTTVGLEAHFKTANGANLIKNQQIKPTEVTIIDGGTTLNPANVTQLFSMLDSVGYFDWINGGGGGSGVDRFDELLDTPDYFGNDGKTLVIDESQLKLIAVAFHNISQFTQLTDVPSAFVPGKYLVVNPAGTGLIFTDLPPAPTDASKLDSGGYPGTGQDLADSVSATNNNLATNYYTKTEIDAIIVKNIIVIDDFLVFKVSPNDNNLAVQVNDIVQGIVEGNKIEGTYLGGDKTLLSSFDLITSYEL